MYTHCVIGKHEEDYDRQMARAVITRSDGHDRQRGRIRCGEVHRPAKRGVIETGEQAGATHRPAASDGRSFVPPAGGEQLKARDLEPACARISLGGGAGVVAYRFADRRW
jgi:hypothetical protein